MNNHIIIENGIKSKLGDTYNCCGCGICSTVCPTQALKIVIDSKDGIYKPIIDLEECINCHICNQVCPANDFGAQNNHNSDLKDKIDIKIIGNSLKTYIGYSNDLDIRYEATSGGIITQLIIYALESGFIDGALLTKMKDNDPLVTETFIARNRIEVIEASKSKYCPVNIENGIKLIINAKKTEHFAVVGLPCHIQAIKKLERINPDFRSKIILHIGLFCSGTPSYLATKYLLRQNKIKEENVLYLSYRGKGWPGNLNILTIDNFEINKPYPYYWGNFGNLFIRKYCKFCLDWYGKDADISVGDAWGSDHLDGNNLGNSFIVIREAYALDLILRMQSEEKISIFPTSLNLIYKSQKGIIAKRKKIRHNIYSVKNIEQRTFLKNKLLDYSINPSKIEHLTYYLFNLLEHIAKNESLWYILDIYCWCINTISIFKHKLVKNHPN